MQQLNFENRVVIITGAGVGIGRAYALGLAKRGARIVVNDLGGSLQGRGADPSVAQAVVDEIRQAGGEAIADCNSVADEASARAIVAHALNVYGTVDAVICNAGVGLSLPFDEITLDQFKEVVGVHLFGTVGVVHAAWPIMKAKSYGRIVLTSSAAGLWGVHNVSGYCAAKAGIIGLAKGLALEAAPLGIKVNVVSPAANTRMSAHLFEGKTAWTWRPELVEPMVSYLASAQCNCNGAVYSAMGGNFARIESMQGYGHSFDARGDISAEDVMAHLDQIDDMKHARALARGRDAGAAIYEKRPE